MGNVNTNTIVVQVHPLEESYNAAIRQRVVDGLRRRPGDSGADPLVFRLAQGETPSPEQLASCRQLVLVYPTWGGGLPSLLLEWVHQQLDAPEALASVSRLIVVTTHGSSLFINRVQAQWGLRYLRSLVLPVCARGCRLSVLPLYKVDRLGPEQLGTFLETVERSMAKLAP